MKCYTWHISVAVTVMIQIVSNVDTYFLPLICLRWWKTLMTSRIRRGASSIFEARLIQAIATIWQKTQRRQRNWKKEFNNDQTWSCSNKTDSDPVKLESKFLNGKQVYFNITCLGCSTLILMFPWTEQLATGTRLFFYFKLNNKPMYSSATTTWLHFRCFFTSVRSTNAHRLNWCYLTLL